MEYLQNYTYHRVWLCMFSWEEDSDIYYLWHQVQGTKETICWGCLWKRRRGCVWFQGESTSEHISRRSRRVKEWAAESEVINIKYLKSRLMLTADRDLENIWTATITPHTNHSYYSLSSSHWESVIPYWNQLFRYSIKFPGVCKPLETLQSLTSILYVILIMNIY